MNSLQGHEFFLYHPIISSGPLCPAFPALALPFAQALWCPNPAPVVGEAAISASWRAEILLTEIPICNGDGPAQSNPRPPHKVLVE